MCTYFYIKTHFGKEKYLEINNFKIRQSICKIHVRVSACSLVNSQINFDDVSMYLKFGHKSITLSKNFTLNIFIQLLVDTFPRFVAIGFLFSIRNPYINRFTNNFSIHS
jgi:hypothetical protein